MSLDLQQERSRAIWRGSALLSWVQVPRNTPDSADKTYASVRFTPHCYDSANVYGKTDLKVRFYFPPGVTPQETRYHERKYDEADRVGDRIVFIYRRPDAAVAKRRSAASIGDPAAARGRAAQL